MDDPNLNTFGVPDVPKVSDSLTAKGASVKDAAQAHDICTRIRDDNKERVAIAAKIREQMDGINPPLSNAKLFEEGKAYKANFSTGVLSTVVGRVAPRLVARIKSVQYLTASTLPAMFPDSTKKTQQFRKLFTDTVRSWAGWNFFVYDLCNQIPTFGKTFIAFDSPDEWRPRCFRLDSAGIPDGVRQGDTPPYFWYDRDYTVAELFELVRDRDTAEAAGWNVDNVVSAINAARPLKEQDKGTTEEAALTYEDMERQIVPFYGFLKAYNAIQLEILFVQEPDKTVSVWITNKENGDELFSAISLYNQMEDVAQYVCYNIGDGSVYGSLGIGEVLYDPAINIEKSRLAAIDALRMRGKIFLEVATKADLTEVVTTVTDDTVYVAGARYQGSQAAIPQTVDGFLALDNFLVRMLQERAGQHLPNADSQGKTATQAQIDAVKEAEMTDSNIDYFLTYMARIISMIQRRMFDPETRDPQAIQARDLALTFLTEEELQIIANQPPAQTTIDWTETRQLQIAQFLQSKQGDPKWDQDLLQRTISDIVIGPEMTQRLMLPPNDNTIAIEGVRQQQEESFNMLSKGLPVLVSPRDNHLVSMGQISGTVEKDGVWPQGHLFGFLQEGNIQAAQVTLDHYASHAGYAEQQGLLGENMNQVKQFMADAMRAIERAQNMQKRFDEQRQIIEAAPTQQ